MAPCPTVLHASTCALLQRDVAVQKQLVAEAEQKVCGTVGGSRWEVDLWDRPCIESEQNNLGGRGGGSKR